MLEEEPDQAHGETEEPALRAGSTEGLQRRALRALRGRPAVAPVDIDGYEFLDHTFDPERRAELADLCVMLEESLAEMPERYRQVVRLRIFEGLPPRAVGAALGIPTETVRTRTRRGLAMLRASVSTRLPSDPLAPRRPFLGILALPWMRRGAERPALAGAAACLSLGVIALLAHWLPGGDATAASPGRTPVVAEEAALPAVPRAGRVSLPAADLRTPETVDDEDVPPAGRYQVSVRRPDGTPAAGAELYGFDRMERSGVRLGVADARGRVDLQAPPGARWIAARGAVGELSDALLLDQPGHAASGAIDLSLRVTEVAWVRVESPPDGPDTGELTMAARPMDERFAVHATARDGIRAAPTPVPAWSSDGPGERAFGVPWGDVPKRLTLWHGGKLLWTSETFEVHDEPPTTVAIRPTWGVTGRVVSADGVPAPGVFVYVHEPARVHHTGTRLTTGPDGSFVLDDISDGRVAIKVRGLRPLTAAAPGEDDVQRRVDVGDVSLPEAEGELRRSVQVSGSRAGDELRGLRFGSVHSWPGQRFAYPGAKHATFRSAGGGLYRAPEDLKSFIALALIRGGSAPLIVMRPPEGWPPERLTVDARRVPTGTLTGSIPEAMLPARVLYTHLETGFPLVDDVEREAALGFTSRPLPPGLWDVLVQGVDGTTARRRAVAVAADRTVDIGAVAPVAGRLELEWPRDLAEGQRCSLIYMRSGVPVAFEARTSGEPVTSPDLEPGSYVVHVAARTGTWLARTEVLPDRTTSARMERDLHVVGVLIGPAKRASLPSDATMEFLDSAGEVVLSVTAAELPRSGKLQWVVPTRDLARLRTTIAGKVFEAPPIRRQRPERTVFHVMQGPGVKRVR